MRSFIRIIATLLVLSASSFAHAAAIEKLHRFLETTKTLKVDFEQIIVARNGKQLQKSTGVMMISRPCKFSWQINKPYAQLLVSEGEKVWIYDPDLHQVTVKRFDAALGSTPASLLVGNEHLEKNFKLSDVGESDGLEWLEATSKLPDSGFDKLRLGFFGNDLKAMQLLDNFGQTTSIFFSRLERNPLLAPTQFRFVPPAGVDFIGE